MFIVFSKFHSFLSISVVSLCCLIVLTSCSTPANKSNGYQSIVIENRTKKEIVKDLATIVGNYGYSIFSESATEVVFETQPNKKSEIAYARYDKNYRNNYYPGYRNRNIKLPRFQILFEFSSIGSGTLVESKVAYISWQHMYDQNKNSQDGIEVQKILNELKVNSQVDSASVQFSKYRTVHQLLLYKISTHKIKSYRKKNYVRKVVLSTIDYGRQVNAIIFVRQQLKNYCNYSGGVFEEENDQRFYSSNGVKIPNVFFNSFNRANYLRAFGIKICTSEDGTMWRLMIKPRVIKPEKKSEDEKINRELTKFKNPELYLYIHMLEKSLPSYMKKQG